MAEKGLCLREATAGDYQAVLDIDREVYQGFDYLASVYFEMIHDKSTHMYVGEVGSEVVAFMAFRLIKGYTVAVSVAMRTSRKLRGKGIAAPFKALALRDVRKKCTTVGELIAAVPTGTFPEYWDKVVSDPSQQESILLKWDYFAYETETKTFDKILKSYTANAVHTVEVEKIGCTVAAEDITRIMEILKRSGNYFNHDLWVVQPVTERSIRYVTKTSNVYVTRGSGGSITAVTHGSIISVDSLAVRLDIWYHGYSNETCFAHSFSFLRDVRRVIGPGTTTVRIMFNYPAAMDKMEADLAHYFGPRLTEPSMYWRTLALLHKSKI